ncbi:hypothetical protein A9W98_13375 [Mycobacterium gordonae]|jgi:hypothetical protein|uniref:Uncharacterized protein n=1 Tax=Mycobacterium gordonae TaxID=1778 RepID=A0A1A6BK36_MYCGO|nr:hypothetical protein A9W98_13375 [Mycobacterium gordonae]
MARCASAVVATADGAAVRPLCGDTAVVAAEDGFKTDRIRWRSAWSAGQRAGLWRNVDSGVKCVASTAFAYS